MSCFPMFHSSFCSMLMLGSYAHMLTCLLRLAYIYVFTCLFPCYVFRSLSSHAYMLGFMFYHDYVLSFYMLTCVLPCLCLDLCFHMLMCLDLCSLHALCYLPCACALCHICVPRPRLYLSCHVLL